MVKLACQYKHRPPISSFSVAQSAKSVFMYGLNPGTHHDDNNVVQDICMFKYINKYIHLFRIEKYIPFCGLHTSFSFRDFGVERTCGYWSIVTGKQVGFYKCV